MTRDDGMTACTCTTCGQAAALASHGALDVADALGLTGEEGLVARPAWDGSLIEAWAL